MSEIEILRGIYFSLNLLLTWIFIKDIKASIIKLMERLSRR